MYGKSLLALLCAILLAGCAVPESVTLPQAVSMHVREGERLWRIVPAEDGCAATLQEPTPIAGLEFRLCGGAITARAGECEIPLSGRMADAATRLNRCFTLWTQTPVDVLSDGEGGYVLRYEGGEAAAVREGRILWLECDGIRYTVEAME